VILSIAVRILLILGIAGWRELLLRFKTLLGNCILLKQDKILSLPFLRIPGMNQTIIMNFHKND